MSKKKLTRRERGQIRWLKRMEPKESDPEKRAKQAAWRLGKDRGESSVKAIFNAIMLEYARGHHEGASNPYC